MTSSPVVADSAGLFLLGLGFVFLVIGRLWSSRKRSGFLLDRDGLSGRMSGDVSTRLLLLVRSPVSAR